MGASNGSPSSPIRLVQRYEIFNALVNKYDWAANPSRSFLVRGGTSPNLSPPLVEGARGIWILSCGT